MVIATVAFLSKTKEGFREEGGGDWEFTTSGNDAILKYRGQDKFLFDSNGMIDNKSIKELNKNLDIIQRMSGKLVDESNQEKDGADIVASGSWKQYENQNTFGGPGRPYEEQWGSEDLEWSGPTENALKSTENNKIINCCGQKTSSEDCKKICNDNHKCNAVVWSPTKDGTCYLRGGKIEPNRFKKGVLASVYVKT